MTFLFKHLTAALGAGVVVLALTASGADHAVSTWFYDAAAGRFPLREGIVLETVMHQWAKYMIVLLACAAIGAWLFSYAAAALRPWRRVLLFVALSLTLAPGAVAAVKSTIDRACPYDLAEFGGYAPSHGPFERSTAGAKPAHCALSGHASGGFALLAFYFAGRALRRPGLARLGLGLGLAVGLVFGITRVAQGAHFLSDTLWAGLACWIVMLGFYCIVFGLRRASSAGPAQWEADSTGPRAGEVLARGGVPRGRLADAETR